MSFFGTMILVMIGVWLGSFLGSKLEKIVSTDYRNDPVYKGNLERLIEHHRQFEKKQ
jgi:hypothetical protein